MDYVIKCFLASIQFRRNIDTPTYIRTKPNDRLVRRNLRQPITYRLVHDRPAVRATIGSWTKQYCNFV